MLKKFIISIIGLVIFIIFFKIFWSLLPILLFSFILLICYRIFIVYFKNKKHKIKSYNKKSNIRF
jgi:hypothetical protein